MTEMPLQPPADTELFEQTDWLEWLDRVFRGEPLSSHYSGEEALYLQLISVYRQLPSKRVKSRFEQAVSRLFATTVTSPQHTEELYHLLQLVSYVKPVGAESLLRQRLLNGRLAELRFEGRELDTQLLVVTAEYGVDPELAYYIQRTVEARDDLRYALVCLRLLAPRGVEEYAPILERVIALLRDEAGMALARRALRAIVATGMGFRWLYEWMRHVDATFDSPQAEQLARFERVILPLAQREEYDPYACLLRGLAEAEAGAVSPSLLLRITHFRRRVTERETAWVLSRMWNVQLRRHPDKAPWSVLYFTENENRILREQPDCEVRNVAEDHYRTSSDEEVRHAHWLATLVDCDTTLFPPSRRRRVPGDAGRRARERDLEGAGV